MALALSLRDRGRPLPAALVLLSPWTDLTESLDSHFQNEELDPLISSEELREAALLYAGGRGADHTRICPPSTGIFTGFPPVLIQVGTR